MDLQPTLEGDLATLRPTVPEDWEGLYAAASDPLIWEVHPAHDRWQESEFLKYFSDALASRTSLTVRDRANDEIIGASRYFGYDSKLDEIEIGWTFLQRAYWGGTYNREIKRMMVNHILPYVGAVIFQVGERNWRSQRAMAKIGGVLRDEVRERAYGAGGKVERQLIYEIRKPMD